MDNYELKSFELKGELPYALEIEEQLIGILLSGNSELIDYICNALTEEAFYDTTYRIIFASCQDLYIEKQSVDVATLTLYLKEHDLLDKIGGKANLVSMLRKSVLHTQNIIDYCSLLKQYEYRRNGITIAEQIKNLMYDGSVMLPQVKEKVDNIMLQLMHIDDSYEDPTKERLSSAMQNEFEKQLNRHEKETVSLMYPKWDSAVEMKPDDLVVASGRPSQGKTYVMMNFAWRTAMQDKLVKVFSLEMSQEKLGQRAIALNYGVSTRDWRKYDLSESKLQVMLDQFTNEHFEISDNISVSERKNISSKTTAYFRNKLKRDLQYYESKKDNPKWDLICVDYLQLLLDYDSPKAASNSNYETQELGKWTSFWKEMAQVHKCPVLLLAQLNRDVEKRNDKRPKMSDLRGCLTGETLITMASGDEKLMTDIQVGDMVKSYDLSSSKLVNNKVTDWWWSGQKEVFIFKLKNGNRVTASENHDMVTHKGKMEAHNVVVGDKFLVTDYDSKTTEWVSVKSIESDGLKDVYDITVDKTHTFIANKIIVGNSGMIEQDADIMVGLYRPNYYADDMDKQYMNGNFENLELLLMKQRDGETGTVHAAIDMATGRME